MFSGVSVTSEYTNTTTVAHLVFLGNILSWPSGHHSFNSLPEYLSAGYFRAWETV